MALASCAEVAVRALSLSLFGAAYEPRARIGIFIFRMAPEARYTLIKCCRMVRHVAERRYRWGLPCMLAAEYARRRQYACCLWAAQSAYAYPHARAGMC